MLTPLFENFLCICKIIRLKLAYFPQCTTSGVLPVDEGITWFKVLSPDLEVIHIQSAKS